MKRLLTITALILVLSVPAFALSDSEYKKFMKNADFAAADKELTKAYKEAKKIMSKDDFEELKEEQREWVKSTRDEEAEELIEEDGLSRVKAYTIVTLSRASDLKKRVIYYVED